MSDGTTEGQSLERRIINWYLWSRDTGISSETMASIAAGWSRRPGKFGDFGAPADGDDFGRCVRLVKAIPEIREAFPAIGRLVPAFRPILRHWDELEGLYDAHGDRWASPTNTRVRALLERDRKKAS